MKLKKWVRQILVVIGLIALIVMASECDNTIVFILSHIIAGAIFTGCAITLLKY